MHRAYGRHVRHSHRDAVSQHRQGRRDGRGRRTNNGHKGAKVFRDTNSTTGRGHDRRQTSRHNGNRRQRGHDHSKRAGRNSLQGVARAVLYGVPLMGHGTKDNYSNGRTHNGHGRRLQDTLQQAVLQGVVTLLRALAERVTTKALGQRRRRHDHADRRRTRHGRRRNRAHNTVPAKVINDPHGQGNHSGTRRLTRHLTGTAPHIHAVARLIERTLARDNHRQRQCRHVSSRHGRPRRSSRQRRVTYKGGHRQHNNRRHTNSSPQNTTTRQTMQVIKSSKGPHIRRRHRRHTSSTRRHRVNSTINTKGATSNLQGRRKIRHNRQHNRRRHAGHRTNNRAVRLQFNKHNTIKHNRQVTRIGRQQFRIQRDNIRVNRHNRQKTTFHISRNLLRFQALIKDLKRTQVLLCNRTLRNHFNLFNRHFFMVKAIVSAKTRRRLTQRQLQLR